MFTLKVGFDWNAPETGAGAGADLRYEFVDAADRTVVEKPNPATGQLAFFFQVQDRLHLQIFDLGTDPGEKRVSVLTTEVRVVPGTQVPPTSTKNPCGQLLPSMSFSGNFAASSLQQDPWGERLVPAWDWNNVFQLHQAGSFEFAFSLRVYNVELDQCRSFSFDPEMQVEPDIPDPDIYPDG